MIISKCSLDGTAAVNARIEKRLLMRHKCTGTAGMQAESAVHLSQRVASFNCSPPEKKNSKLILT